jgi:hypothetical protein
VRVERVDDELQELTDFGLKLTLCHSTTLNPLFF